MFYMLTPEKVAMAVLHRLMAATAVGMEEEATATHQDPEASLPGGKGPYSRAWRVHHNG